MTDKYAELEERLGYALSEETRVHLALHDLWSEGRASVIQGVGIDLRHPLLDADWSPTWLFGGAGTGPHREDAPWLVFPWTEAWDRKARRGAGRSTVIQAGDRVRIELVKRVRVGTEIDHPADRERRDAYLIVERSSGGKVRPKRPVVFWPRLSLMRPRLAGRPTFPRVAARVCEALGIEDLESYQFSDEDGISLTEAAGEEALSVRIHLKMLTDHLSRPVRSDWDSERDRILDDIVNSAVAFGYQASQAEAERFMAPAANARRKIVAAARQGGERGAVTRRRNGELWRNRARPIILQIMHQSGIHTRDNVANEVEARWTWPQRCPSVSSLKGLLAEMEALGEVSFPKS